MTKSEKTKEKIISKTIELIKETNGNSENITIRKIAQQCEIGIGLINHYFINKDKLIECCIQRIINDIVVFFKPTINTNLSKRNRVHQTACKVYDFFMFNPSISKISIIGDLSNPMILDNTSKSQMGFINSLNKNSDDYQDKLTIMILVFMMQESFLRRNIIKEQLGCDLNIKEERDKFIKDFVDIIVKED